MDDMTDLEVITAALGAAEAATPRKRMLPPVVIGPDLMAELGEDRGHILVRLMQAGIRVVMDPFGIDDTPIDVQRLRWHAAREAVTEAEQKTD